MPEDVCLSMYSREFPEAFIPSNNLHMLKVFIFDDIYELRMDEVIFKQKFVTIECYVF